MGWRNKGPPMAFLKDGKMVRSPKDIANMQVTHFHEEKKIQQLPPTVQDPLKVLKLTFSRWKNINVLLALQLQPVTLLETSNSLKKLGNGIYFGNDKIDSLSIKIVSESLLNQLTF